MNSRTVIPIVSRRRSARFDFLEFDRATSRDVNYKQKINNPPGWAGSARICCGAGRETDAALLSERHASGKPSRCAAKFSNAVL